jgi:hypothetical protein
VRRPRPGQSPASQKAAKTRSPTFGAVAVLAVGVLTVPAGVRDS